MMRLDADQNTDDYELCEYASVCRKLLMLNIVHDMVMRIVVHDYALLRTNMQFDDDGWRC